MSTVIAFGPDETVRSPREGTWTMGREQSASAEYGTRIHISEETGHGGLDVSRPSMVRREHHSAVARRDIRVKRRIQGFFIQEEGQEARVALVDNGKLIDYRLPLSLLREGGVHAENQPFELDELETKSDGVVFTGYKIRASAPVGASHTVPLPLDAERKAKLARILSRRSDAQG